MSGDERRDSPSRGAGEDEAASWPETMRGKSDRKIIVQFIEWSCNSVDLVTNKEDLISAQHSLHETAYS